MMYSCGRYSTGIVLAAKLCDEMHNAENGKLSNMSMNLPTGIDPNCGGCGCPNLHAS
jgi:hypothetical protein